MASPWAVRSAGSRDGCERHSRIARSVAFGGWFCRALASRGCTRPPVDLGDEQRERVVPELYRHAPNRRSGERVDDVLVEELRTVEERLRRIEPTSISIYVEHKGGIIHRVLRCWVLVYPLRVQEGTRKRERIEAPFEIALESGIGDQADLPKLQ